MWKVLLVISAIVLGGAAWFAYETMEEAKKQVAEVGAQKDLLASRLKSIEDTTAQVVELEAAIQVLRDQTETLETEKIDLDVRVVEAESNLSTRQQTLAQAKEKLEGAKELIENIQKVEAIQREMVQVRTQIEESEIELSQAEGALVRAQVERDRLEKVAAELSALRADQEAGVIRGQFQSTVKAAYNQWGFVIINGGNDQGVVNRAQLDVYRRGQPICKLLVTSVDPGESSAEIIPGSLAPGQSVQVGDTVVAAVRMQQPPAQTPAQAGGTTPAPAATDALGAPSAPADDPFGGGMQAPAADPDAFGAPAMDAPAPAPADDPFGAPPAMDAPAPAPGDDPFGGGAGMEAPAPAPEAPDAPDAPAPDPFQ